MAISKYLLAKIQKGLENFEENELNPEEAVNLDSSSTPAEAGEPVENLPGDEEQPVENGSTDVTPPEGAENGEGGEEVNETSEEVTETETESEEVDVNAPEEEIPQDDDTGEEVEETVEEESEVTETESEEVVEESTSEEVTETEEDVLPESNDEPNVEEEAPAEEAGDEQTSEDSEKELGEDLTEEEKDEVVADLESIRELIQKDYNTGGVSIENASVIEIMLTPVLKRLGLESHSIVPSASRFLSKSGRLTATNVMARGLDILIAKLKGE